MNPNFHPMVNIGNGLQEPAPTAILLGHEIGHMAYHQEDEQITVDKYENPIRLELGMPCRGSYN